MAVALPDSLKTIGDKAFQNCGMLVQLEIPAGIAEIGSNAIPKQVKLYGTTGTCAQDYARENGLVFVDSTIGEETGDNQNTPVVKVITAASLFDINAVHEAAAETVEKLRENGLLAEDAVCLVMDGKSLSFDITTGNNTKDLVLSVDSEGVYTLALDYDFWFLEGFGPLVNGIDPAPYNKEMLQNFLGLISNEPMTLFNTIDMVYFSSYGLSGTSYLAVGDCYMMDGLSSVPNAWSFKIKK